MKITEILKRQKRFFVVEREDIRFYLLRHAATVTTSYSGDAGAQNNLGVCYALGVQEDELSIDINLEKSRGLVCSGGGPRTERSTTEFEGD